MSSSQHKKILQQHWSYSSFRPGQEPIVQSILNHRDTLAIMPTGGGKSICFQVPGLTLPGLTVVVSPLISLMSDQVDALCKKNIRAAYYASTLTEQNRLLIRNKLKSKKLKFLYISPESLHNQNLKDLLHQQQISLLVIDEAHCISQWGHDFRPAYQRIATFVSQLNFRPTIAAFTATATQITAADIISSLQLESPGLFIHQAQNTHISLAVHKIQTRTQKNLKLLSLIEKYQGQAGIIYTLTRSSTQFLASYLNFYVGQKFTNPVRYYHGGMSAEERFQVQSDFISNRTQLIVATNAFGMGVDKPDIRFVIHYHLPSSMEAYVQEVGRAGRDRKQSTAHLLFLQSDLKINASFLENKSGAISDSTHSKKLKLKSMIQFAQSNSCRQKSINEYFSYAKIRGCNHCDYCNELQTIMKNDYSKRFSFLLQIRIKIAKLSEIPPTQVFSLTVASYLALLQPQSVAEIAHIPGIGAGWLQQNKKWTQLLLVACSQ